MKAEGSTVSREERTEEGRGHPERKYNDLMMTMSQRNPLFCMIIKT